MSAFHAVKQIYKRFLLRLRARARPIRIILGAGYTNFSGWIPTDLDTLNILKESDWTAYFQKDSIEAMLAEHVWEHITVPEGLQAARRCFDFLKRGGYLRLAVPDGFHPDSSYIRLVAPNGTGEGAHDHKVLYTYKTLADLLQQVGYKVQFLEYFDETGAFHSTNWDLDAGPILRSARLDVRNRDGQLKYTSIIVDAVKP